MAELVESQLRTLITKSTNLMERPSISQTNMEIAFTVSRRSTCSRRHNGAVIADSKGVVLSTGYNGSLSGFDHCDHECDCFAELNELPHEQSCPANPNNGCTTAVHAEANSVYFAARKGVSVEGCIIYCTTEPCVKCAEAIIQSGIAEVVYSQSYRLHNGIELLKQANIEVVQL
jgi:dCMP deaminase